MTDKGKTALKTGLTITAIIILCGYIAYTIFQCCDVSVTMGDESKAEADKWMRNTSGDRMKNLYGKSLASSPTLPEKTAAESEMMPEELLKKAETYVQRKEFKQAVECYRKAAEQGNDKAQFNLGICYANGIGVERDFKQAAYWFRKAAEQGNDKAQVMLGASYAEGIGVEKDFKQAAYWYRRAAEQGNADAKECLLELPMLEHTEVFRKEDVNREMIQAVRESANYGGSYAQYELGKYYASGSGVIKDYEKAVFWFRKAAEQGHVGAQFALGVCYENGLGAEKDLKQAEYWYRKAANQDDPEAQKALKSLGR